jgi:mRNA-degrading endonuclease HigB of HigAB toxin-antitoxin module
MKLLGRNRLKVLYGMDDQTDAWVRGWVSELSHANWKMAKDVLRQFPKASSVANDVFLFPVGLQPQCIQVAIIFPQAVALVTNLKSTS